jgi:poly(A) polymerase/tRNA nucleotidyltransferase (CCA-adding enzyme)
MSLDAEGHLWDYWTAAPISPPAASASSGDPATRLAEDYLRALRSSASTPATRKALRTRRPSPPSPPPSPASPARIAPERIWMELKRLLKAPDPTGALD